MVTVDAAMSVSKAVSIVVMTSYSLLSNKDCWNAAHAARARAGAVKVSFLMHSVKQESIKGGIG